MAHAFVDDGSGLSCDLCPAPPNHPVHAVLEPGYRSATAPLPAPESRAVSHTPEQTGTSSAAAFVVWPKAGTQRRRILDSLIDTGERGATDDELGALLHLPANSVRPRRGELAETGWIELARHDDGTPRTRLSDAGNDAQVWTLTARGRAEARTLVPA